ncbi:sensor histidine kinase [Rickettsia endosymbiont of Cardiosporidium cionae]|uniref:sensor histidine kinase n=1 Tax=Rickettsia endosymbiont of Cardiosporidium cionae TaxID=2777155 RepID=UPI0018949FAB|nr:HAMP domain-containing sensor histidine kinase [Rickettsia endosymbiont of Cardiosporidium cionae]
MISFLLYHYTLVENVVIRRSLETNKNLATQYYQNFFLRYNKEYFYKGFKVNNLELDQKYLNDFKQLSKAFFANISSTVSILNISNNQVSEFELHSFRDDTQYPYKNLLLPFDSFFLRRYYNIDFQFDALYKGIDINTLHYSKLDQLLFTSYIPVFYFLENGNQHCLVLQVKTNVSGSLNDIIRLDRNFVLMILISSITLLTVVASYKNYYMRSYRNRIRSFIDYYTVHARNDIVKNVQSEFLSTVSHELRTPLNSIIGFSDIILSQNHDIINDQLKLRDYIKNINQSGKKLLDIINDILDFAQISSNNMKIDNLELDLNKVILSVLRLVESMVFEQDITLVTKIEESHVIVNADSKRLKQVLLHLLHNAIQITPCGGVIIFSVTKDKSENLVYITIIDNGVRKDEAERSDNMYRFFGFQEIDSENEYPNTVLGLPITKKIIEMMNGKIEIDIQTGIATKISILLPYTEDITDFTKF